MIECISYPNQTRNYCVFDNERISQRKDLDMLKKSLENPVNEDEIVEDLYILNCMLDDGEEKIAELYPTLSRYNNTRNPNIQTFLAGIYRKIKVPDAFGPLCVMLIQNAINPPENCNFDPNEEIGGAILDYLA